MTKSPLLKPLERLLGSWTTESTHPALAGVVVHGTVVVEWLEGEQFLLHRAEPTTPTFRTRSRSSGTTSKIASMMLRRPTITASPGCACTTSTHAACSVCIR